MTLEQFAAVFGALAIQLRFSDADELTIRAYYDALQDLEIELVRAAAFRLTRTAEWFPKTSEWRDVCETIRHEHRSLQRQLMARAIAPLCAICDDTGWQHVQSLERERSVDRVQRCSCWQQRRNEQLAAVDARHALAAPVERTRADEL